MLFNVRVCPRTSKAAFLAKMNETRKTNRGTAFSYEFALATKMTINLCDTAKPSVNQFFRYYPSCAKRWKLSKKSQLIARFTEEHKIDGNN